ncbi:MAG: acyl-CoA/acyl-ACP dehydrogenase [Actinomycetota bacterium]|nr:acyl-CoA/acyl-ACP dehydrogenase [Actinomycetota bacterium]MDQ6945711.1 acyl-CoA/acyl-ACP dehydrogenase [Actinomycetota bacterium]
MELTGDPVGVARAVAEDLLFPAALAIERSHVVPLAYLDALADGGLYGLFAPADVGGFDADPLTAARVIEILGGASLTTAFIWIQHHNAVRALRFSRSSLRDAWLAPLAGGMVRSGIAYAALRRPGPPAMEARPAGDGWLLTGEAPWVTGWGRIGIIIAGARRGDHLVWALLDASEAPTLTATPLELAAVAASSTVTLRLEGHPVGADRVVEVEAFADWRRRDALDPRSNGYLALGVAARAASLTGDPSLTAAVDRAREALDGVEGAQAVMVRAKVSLLAVRVTTALMVQGGGRSIELGHHAQRLAREAMFLLVFGQTSSIRAAQMHLLTGAGPICLLE